MTNCLILVICVFAVVNLPAIRALKRSKRSLDSYPKHATITKDFAVINENGKEDAKQNMKKITDIKDKDNLFDNILQSLNASKAKGPDDRKHNLDLNKKRGVNSPLAYILNNHERKFNDHHSDSHRAVMLTSDKDSNSRGGAGEKNPSKDSNHASDRLSENSARANDVQHMLALARGSGNLIGAHIVIPPQSMPQYTASNPYAPIDQLLKMANMVMFKVGMGMYESYMAFPYEYTISPYRTQSTQMTFTPNMLMSLQAPNTQHLLYDDIRPNSDYILKPVEGPPLSELHHLTPRNNNNNNGLQSRTVFYAPPLIFKHPISVDEPKELISFIENALGSVLANSDSNDDDEIDLTCPIHHEKKSVVGDGKCDGGEITGNGNEGGVIQVCSCRLIKKGKNEINKEQK